MLAEFSSLQDLTSIELRILGDWDDPTKLVSAIAQQVNLPPKPNIAISDRSLGEDTSAYPAFGLDVHEPPFLTAGNETPLQDVIVVD